MWLVSGVDEEHRFRDWTEAADYYRAMVHGWTGAHGDADGLDRAVDELAVGQSHETVFPGSGTDGDDAEPTERGPVTFRIGWEVPQAGLGVITAC